MAIKQLPFEKGEEFGIRQKGHRLPSDEVMENMKWNLENDTLIVKCGKSFWDVSAYPEIYEAGDEFRVEDLTSIDRKQMEKAAPPKPAFEESAKNEPSLNPMAYLFHKTEPEEPEQEPVALVRKTYYLEPKHVEALTILCHDSRVELSAMVREIFDRGLPSIGIEMGYDDIYAVAEANLSKNGLPGKRKYFKKK